MALAISLYTKEQPLLHYVHCTISFLQINLKQNALDTTYYKVEQFSIRYV